MDPYWSAAIATFGVGDLATTYVGLQTEGVEEAHPLSERILGVGGVGGMTAWKLAVMVAFYLAYLRVNREHRDGIPIGLAVLGTAIVLNNLAVTAEAKERADE